MDKEELEQNLDYYAKRAKSAESHIIRQNKRIADLEKENAELKKACDETQELLDKQIEATYKLHKENTELKEKLKPENCLKLLAKEGYVKFTSEQLIKAKELLLELYDCIPSSMADSCKETLQKVALFFKDSEVEK